MTTKKHKPKFSPGPWSLGRDDNGDTVILDASGGVVLGLHWSNPEDASLVMGDDDAGLFAASRDLYDAAREALDMLGRLRRRNWPDLTVGGGPCPGEAWSIEVEKRLRAALEKAEGRDP